MKTQTTLTIDSKKFESGRGVSLRQNEKDNNSPVVGRLIHTQYTGAIEFVFPTVEAARAYASNNPHTWTRTRQEPTGTTRKETISWPRRVRYDAEISRFGGQSPYIEEAGSLTRTVDNMMTVREETPSWAGIIAGLL